MSLAINNLSTVYKNPFVQGSELQQVSNSLFEAAKSVSSSTTASTAAATRTAVTQNSDVINLFNTDFATTKQIAANTANFDVAMNAQTQQALQSLRAQAAQANIAKIVEGKIFVPVEAAEVTQPKEIVTLTTKPETFNVADMGSDRKGSNPFSVFSAKTKDDKKEETEAPSIF